MVQFSEGLRAPGVGERVNYSAPQVNPGRAAMAIAAAAIVGASSGDAVARLGANAASVNPAQNLPTRTTAPPTANVANPYLQGIQAAKAPSMGTVMPSVPQALSGASGGVPPRISGMGNTGLGMALPSLAIAAAEKALSGANLKGSPLGNFLAPIQKLAEANRLQREAQGLANGGKIDGFLADLADKMAGRNKDQRKGDTKPPKTKPNSQKPLTGQRPIRYSVEIIDSTGTVAAILFLFGPISPIQEIDTPENNGKEWLFNGGDAVVRVAGAIADYAGQPAPHFGDIKPLDGSEDPLSPYIPQPVNENGSPILGGLTHPATTPTTPALSDAAARSPNPVKTGSLPAAGTAPRDSFKPPSTPGAPASSPDAPSVPSVGNPLPGVSPALPGIPSAPTTGSASLSSPAFPSAFTEFPGSRNPDTLKAIEPATPQPSRSPQLCADPCMATLQMQQAGGLEGLAGLAELLAQLLAAQQQQGQEEAEKNTLITIAVPVCSCNPDGTAAIQSVEVQVLASQEALVVEQFTQLAAMQSAQCQIQRHTDRSHNILGGDTWFADAASRTPAFKTRIERKVKEAGTLFGFPALVAETGTPSTVGQVTATSMIELLNAYTSNLYHRAGFQGLPTEVPKTLLGYTDDEAPEAINDLSSYFVWFVKQVDALIGKFPINITIEDIDPLTEGNQTKEIELPNIAEALAEMYGTNLATSVNADVTVNFLMRLASELIATKNASLITQDYAKANAAFLGYKGNPARREIDYSFNPSKLDSLDEFLKESKGYLVGWEEDDKESVVGFLQRIVFSSGIIKSVFFRDKKRLAELQKELENMITSGKASSDAEWEALLAMINDPTDYFNKDAIPRPRVRKKPVPPPEATP